MSTIHRHRFELIIMLVIIAGLAGSLWYLQRGSASQQVRAASAQQQTDETLDAATFTASLAEPPLRSRAAAIMRFGSAGDRPNSFDAHNGGT